MVTQFEEGSAIDRVILTVLIALALRTLVARQVSLIDVCNRNAALAGFVVYTLASVVWSDFPFITFKRWFRDLDMYLMVLVILSDPQPLEAIVLVIRRLSYPVLFFSVLLIKYYTPMGVMYDSWTGLPEYTGATTSKNMLGLACLVSGLFFFWDTLNRWPDRKAAKTKRIILLNVGMIAVILWLLQLSHSATSQGCLLIGCPIIVILRSTLVKDNPRIVKLGAPAALAAYVLLELTLDPVTMVAEFFERDASLHGRTGIWEVVLALQPNPLLGAGYQSFWLGDRLTTIWLNLKVGFLNEAHNGYLEIYLSLGLLGLALLVLILISSYRRVCSQVVERHTLAPLSVAIWAVTVIYNVTESAFGASLLLSVLLLCTVAVPTPSPTAALNDALRSAPGADIRRLPSVRDRRGART
jgi:O-antigen ligase